ncbi:MAG: HAD-IA family hydrolase, partial [Candidatus Diapherotrites archaeon]|nr:HAD-IA family hydrolase [Candidatus Diapherotrites archaeon]
GELAGFFGMKVSEFIQAVLKKYRVKADWEKLMAQKYKILEKLIEEKGIRPLPGAIELAKAAKKSGLKIAVASGSRKKFVFPILKKMGLEKTFDLVLCADDVKKGKPNPEIFLKCAKRLRVQPKNCLVLEDAENGIIAAKRAGMKAIALKSGYSGKQDFSKANKVVKSLEEIKLDTLP